MKRLLLPLATTLVLACAAQPEPGPWQQADGYRWRELHIRGGRPGFTDVRAGAGIDFSNEVSDSLLLGNRVLGQGAGVSLGDVDGDGWPDIFLARTEGCNALYRNLGGWKFEDITDRAGVGACDRFSSGSAFADIEGDGDLDLILLATTGPNAVFVNDGSGVFTEHRDFGLDPTGRGGTTITMADANGDGRLDLYVANYKAWNIDDSIPPQRRAANQVVRQVGPDRYEIAPEFREHYKLVMRPDMGGLRMTTRAEPDDFYEYVDGTFVRVPLTSDRFRDPDGRPLEEEPESFTLAARFADLNGDGTPDLYVANDFEDTDELWFNDGRGNFRRADWRAMRQMSNSSMGFDVADVNGDAWLDLFATDMLSNDPVRLHTQVPTHTALPKQAGDMELQLQQQRNTLFMNRGDGTFAESGYQAGVEASGWSWGSMFSDVDLDGWPDILIANGHLWDIMDADTHERIALRLTQVNWRRLRWEFPPLPLNNVAFRNRGDMTFEDASEAWGFAQGEDYSHALASADLDGDGDLDVVVNRLRSQVLVLRNNASAPRVAVRLVGDAPNTRAVGAKVMLQGGAIPTQLREVAVGGLYMSHSDYELSFAMGSADSATLVVEWRDGRRSVLRGVRPNRLYEITPAVPSTAEGTVQQAADAGAERRGAVFQDVSTALGGHVHAEAPFNDWERQPLLHTALSQLGPGVSWFDFDRDGDEDLIVGAGRGGRLGLFRNEAGRFVPLRDQGPGAEADFTTILGLAGATGPRLLAGVSSWESGVALAPAVVAIAAGRTVASRTTPAVSPLDASVGALAAADYDGDGTVDLFVGGRARPGAYPATVSSWLYRQDNGAFRIDSANSRLLAGVGLVSAATFADMDGDGDPDLLLARDWDSILLLLNDNGTFRVAPDTWVRELERWTSRWNGIATGDLNGDGRLDIVATSWGRNTELRADSLHPLVILHGPVGPGGREEMFLARHDDQRSLLAPLNTYAVARRALEDLPSRIPSVAAYARATMDEVLGPHMQRMERREITTLDHMVFLNSGNSLEATPLPAEAQLAPAFYVGVADFTGDGNEDVFLAQNFFATALGVPRYDAGRGLLLRGDGTGGLEPLSASESGIEAYGEQRGAAYADFDQDGRLDIVLSQNAAGTKLFRNRSARPGLRVRVNGPVSNPDAIGAQVRLVFGDEPAGPVREIQAGSGYWSQNGTVQVFGMPRQPTAVEVRWPGGVVTRQPVPPGAREVTVPAPR